MGRPVRRVLFRGEAPSTVISLGDALPRRSSGLPGDSAGRVIIPCLALLRARFAVRAASPRPRWSLTPPFHPYRAEARRSALCGTVSRIAPGGCYPPPCPVEPGRSSVRSPATRPSSRPIRTPDSTVRSLPLPRRARSADRAENRAGRSRTAALSPPWPHRRRPAQRPGRAGAAHGR